MLLTANLIIFHCCHMCLRYTPDAAYVRVYSFNVHLQFTHLSVYTRLTFQKYLALSKNAYNESIFPFTPIIKEYIHSYGINFVFLFLFLP